MTSLKDDLKSKKLTLGLDRTLKKVRNQKIKIVYIASNSNAKDQLLSLGKSMGVEVVVLSENSKELGILCKKPFSVSVLGFE